MVGRYITRYFKEHHPIWESSQFYQLLLQSLYLMWFCCLQRINLEEKWKDLVESMFKQQQLAEEWVSIVVEQMHLQVWSQSNNLHMHMLSYMLMSIILLESPFIHCLQELSEQGGQDTHSKNLLKKVFNLMTNVMSKYSTVGLRVSITGLFCWSIFYETQGLDPMTMSEILLWDWTHQSHGIHTMKPSSAVVRNLPPG